ncbi:hypothetical protein [Sediminicoccus sp. BL-A-41-H5]|uniref:hypothetical protein n=1 Tax=Sediminicoccus sp. BL-A-41-H5 TaxID=3421106 RepID=UPI003D670A67
MSRLPAAPRPSRAGHEEMSFLECALVAAFVLAALVAAVPAIPVALRSAARHLLAPFA